MLVNVITHYVIWYDYNSAVSTTTTTTTTTTTNNNNNHTITNRL